MEENMMKMKKEPCTADFDFVWFDGGEDKSEETVEKHSHKSLETDLDEQVKEVLDSSTNMLIQIGKLFVNMC